MYLGFLRCAVANPRVTVADPKQNGEQILRTVAAASAEGAELIVFPELSLTGYTCGDLFLQSALVSAAEKELARIAAETEGNAALLFIGLPVRFEDKLYDACAILQRGRVLGVVPKTHLPEYGEFNELRWFASGKGVRGTVRLAGELVPLGQLCVDLGGVTVGVEICEDLWACVPPSSETGAMITVNLSASSETVGKAEKRRALVCSQSLRLAGAYLYADAGRGESTTDLVFSGHGILAENGTVLAENLPFGAAAYTIADIDTDMLRYARAKINTFAVSGERMRIFAVLPARGETSVRRPVSRLPFVVGDADAERILSIQAEGLRKRMETVGARKLVLGVSGGLDSALALLVCLRALKAAGKTPDKLSALGLPGFGTSRETAANALSLAAACGAEHRIIDIVPSVKQHLADIGHDGVTGDVTFENAQARMRTMILMDIANREGGLVVGTGDLSEAALGWCTYGGDHMSMYAVNGSVPKTLVRRLADYEAVRLGGDMEKALRGVLSTPVSPELLPTKDGKIAQKTEDILGSFERNDFFLYYAVFCGCAPEKVLAYAAAAFGGKPSEYREGLAHFYRRFFASQFKRSCAPDGVKVGFALSPRGDWRMPSDASVQVWLSSVQEAHT